jgi:hypothetical protein
MTCFLALKVPCAPTLYLDELEYEKAMVKAVPERGMPSYSVDACTPVHITFSLAAASITIHNFSIV